MLALMNPLREMAEYDQIAKELKQKNMVSLSGCVDSQKLHLAHSLGEDFSVRLLITYSDLRAREIREEYLMYDRNTFVFPGKDLIFYQADIHGNQLIKERIRVLRKLFEGGRMTIVTTYPALLTPLLSAETFQNSIVKLQKGSEIQEKKLIARLVDLGYEKTHQVEEGGQFSVRGGIIDIFDLTEENPYRIELWGEEIESIRSFDCLSQRSIENLESVSIYPATEMILTESQIQKGMARIEKEAAKQIETLRKAMLTEEAHRLSLQIKELQETVLEFRSFYNLESYMSYFLEEVYSFADYFGNRAVLVVLDEPSRIIEQVEGVEAEFSESMKHRLEKGYILPGQSKFLFTKEQVFQKLKQFPIMKIGMLEERNALWKTNAKYSITAKSMVSYNNSFPLLVKDLKRYKKEGYRVLLLCPSGVRGKRLAQDLREEELTAVFSTDPMREIQPGEVVLKTGTVKRGFEYPLLKFVVISESDIFAVKKQKKAPKKKYEGARIQDFSELKIGDYVVHERYGVGIYRGIEKVEVEKIVKDYIKIEYRDGGELFVLATCLDLLQKYSGSEGKKPKINKLGTKEWSNTRQKVKSAVSEVAKDLVELYAARQAKQGYQYGPDTVWQREFEELFPYEETQDQLTAIEATKADMESHKIMDRLICGDVGYGKTEIALRGAFKAVQEGKQVAFLVPTTILAQQHYNTFIQRMSAFPVRVDLLSRFKTTTEQKNTIEGLKKGLVDIVIGTHRLLSKDVVFKDLGLLVVDEEQRFGVTHKEKIKQMKDDVDVLMLSATPIPRTLHMSLAGIRDMSVLEEAPGDRVPIQTYVCEYNMEMVREAISRELARGGQVYYVYNRVNNIADIAQDIQELVPEANVAYAHGQMKENELERIMFDFISGEINVLVSTTIIETGLDISNVNTIIIHDSDRFGLSQLYQLRGRVGRSNRTAYAFLMYKRDRMISEVAEKRLEAIREFTDLGIGFKIAMRDLEIRGAGNLLGRKQHGHMEAVGYDMYCKMLNEAVKKLKGQPTRLDDFTTLVDLDVDAFIPSSYIVNEIQKLEIYKRIASIETEVEAEEMKEELLDRFGTVPSSVINLLRISLIRVLAHKLYINEIQGKGERISFIFRADAPLQGEKIPLFLKQYKNKLQFKATGTPEFTYRFKKTTIVEKDVELLLQNTEHILKDIEDNLYLENKNPS